MVRHNERLAVGPAAAFLFFASEVPLYLYITHAPHPPQRLDPASTSSLTYVPYLGELKWERLTGAALRETLPSISCIP